MGVEEKAAAALQADLELEDLFLLLGVWYKVCGTIIDYPITLDPHGPFCCCWYPLGSIQATEILSMARS